MKRSLLILAVLAALLTSCARAPLAAPSPHAPTPVGAVPEPTSSPTPVGAVREPSASPMPSAAPTLLTGPLQLPTGTIALYGVAERLGAQEGLGVYALGAGGAATDLGVRVPQGALLSGDGRWIAYLDTSSPGAGAVVVRNLQSGDAHAIPLSLAAGGGSARQWAFDPDTTRLAFLEVAPSGKGKCAAWSITVVQLASGSSTRYARVSECSLLPGIPLGWAASGDLLLDVFRPYTERWWANVWAFALPPGQPAQSVEALSRRQLLAPEAQGLEPRLSPAGTHLLYLVRDPAYTSVGPTPTWGPDMAVNQLWTLDVQSGASGRPARLVEVADGGALAGVAAWSPGGDEILYVEGRYLPGSGSQADGPVLGAATLKVASLSGAVHTVGPLPEEGHLTGLDWCAPGTALATFTRGTRQTLYAVDLATGSATRVAAAAQVAVLGGVLAAAPAPSPSPVALAVEPIASPFEHRRLAAGTPIAQAGIFFMQVPTGEIEAWSLPGVKSALFSASPDNRWVIANTANAAYLADRQSGVAFRWTSGVLASQGDYLLLTGEAQIWIAGPGQPKPVALPIRPGAPQAVMSPDGRAAAVLSGGTLYLVQLKDGTCRAIGTVADAPGNAILSLLLQTGRRGEAIVVNAYCQEGTGAQQQPTRRVERYSWQGERLGELLLPGAGRFAYSPDGRLVAWDELVSYVTQAVVVADATSLAPRFRILGASLCFDDLGSGDWLADSSSLIVRTSEGYRIVTAGGDLKASPALSTATGEPLPAPDRSDLFAIGRIAVMDTGGQRLASAVLGPAGSQWTMPADVYPWGLDSRELRFALPHLGHGGKCEDENLLPARVERAPFKPLVLAVELPANDCANLRAEPGPRARVLACLPGGTQLAPAPSAEQLPPESGVMFATPGSGWVDGDCWLRVRAPDGQEGWVAARAGAIKCAGNILP